MSEVVDSDEELPSNYRQTNQNMQTHESDIDELEQLPQLEHLKVPTKVLATAGSRHGRKPSIS